MIQDPIRRADALHPIDCSCCTPADERLDIVGIAWRFIVGLGWGGLIALCLSVLTGVPVV